MSPASKPRFRPGIDDEQAVGRAGQYRPGIGSEVLLLGTTIARGHEFFTPGDATHPLLSPALPLDYQREHLGSSWTGRSLRFRWGRSKLSLHLRSTLPGPCFADFGRRLDLRFAFGNAPGEVQDLESGRRFGNFEQDGLGRILLLRGGRMPALLVCSQAVERWRVTSHEHLSLHFRKPATVIWLPLLDERDAPRSAGKQRDWLQLIAAPPLSCSERYAVNGDRLHVRQRFASALDGTGARCRRAPLPPLTALLGSEGGLQKKLPRGRRLCDSLLGPYRVVDGARSAWSIDLRWRHARLHGGKRVAARGLAPIPDELAYAGDVSWEPGTPMDQMLALRVWAPLAEIAPESLWRRLKPKLALPSPAAFRRSLVTLTEPISGERWSKDAALFAERGDVSYDSDWYNGFTLSGLERAVHCSDPAISEPARTLSDAVRPERDQMIRYFQVFHDWALGSAWTDPRGETWNLDCVHNGMEGLLAEARLREAEGDRSGAEHCLYLAGKTAAATMAAYPLADHSRQTGWVLSDSGGDPTISVMNLREWRGAQIDTPAARAPYGLAGNFPQWNALLARHGRVADLRRCAQLWQREHPERYRNWIVFYLGKRPKRKPSADQESRVQGAVMYHLAPDVALRLWTLRQSGASVEGLFSTPINLAEQLWCRSGAQLVV